ncbi:hypothetical protein [Sphingomonas corticis]|jgi:hypothetical protein|uniref:Uncharacterized protein n=1 Tax=Sphingomonas corticis TaxID=2722791 RepID=A0ABX1CP30_9SPHN|nr:hypothetical protein [Sphingomonas corticis]NJR79654.1 hypothetical protein [Sphingomonas corticis]
MRPLAALLLLLAGCSADAPANDAQDAVAALDAELTANAMANAADPALTAALRDQIMVDPQLVQQANDDAVRPSTTPASGAIPAEDIADAATPQPALGPLRDAPPPARNCPQCAAARRALARCAANVSYSAAWANRLPSGVPLYPDARVGEAAGADGGGCALRIVSFSTRAPVQRVLDFYFTRTSAAGFAAGHGVEGAEHALGGRRADGGAFLTMARARGDGGTDVDLMVDGE